MADADLIYNALLRAEKRLEAITNDGAFPIAAKLAAPALIALEVLREEIGTGLSEQSQ